MVIDRLKKCIFGAESQSPEFNYSIDGTVKKNYSFVKVNGGVGLERG